MNRAIPAARLVLGAAMLLGGVNYFVRVVPLPTFDDPLAKELMTAFADSGLLGVAQAIHLVAGALLLGNRLVPFALAALMPVNTCALYVALGLERAPLVGTAALLLFALNGLLMLACLDDYRGVLERRGLAWGEAR